MKITLAYPHGRHQPDETIELDDDEARGLVRDGWARLFAGDKPTTVDEIKTSVGTDAELAQVALDEELASDAPRTTLVAHLERVVADAAPPE